MEFLITVADPKPENVVDITDELGMEFVKIVKMNFGEPVPLHIDKFVRLADLTRIPYRLYPVSGKFPRCPF